MARLRHRMRSRRGGTRGGFIRSQASTSYASDSPDSTTEMPNPLIYPSHRYPNTRSGRGRRDGVVRSADFPLPPYLTPHNTQFRFRSSLNRPTITATVTISFTEEPELQAPLSSLRDKQSRKDPSCRGIIILGNKQQSDSRVVLHGKAKVGDSSNEDAKHNGTKALGNRQNDTCERQMGAPPTQGCGVSEADDDWYQFACWIEEESAPEEPPA